MAVYRACYCTRRDVLSATDIQQEQSFVRHVDSALEAAAEEVDRICKRRFWNAIETVKRDWPNFQRAYPWRVWMDAKEVADSDGSSALAVTPAVTSGGSSIPNTAIFWGPWSEDAPPFTWFELDRSKSYSFGVGSTPQQDISITALFGYWTQTKGGGTLAAAVSSTSATSLTVSDASLVGVGDVIILGTEQLLVQDAAFSDTGVAGSGAATAENSDNVITVPDGTKFDAGEVLLVDSEQMLVLTVVGNQLTVLRAYNGTVLDSHAVTELYAQRTLTVQRGFGDTTAATHLQGSSVLVHRVPGMVREAAIAEALNYVYQKTSAYARTIGENNAIVPGGSLPDLRKRLAEQFGRKVRRRVI